jgi:hypothetical protein
MGNTMKAVSLIKRISVATLAVVLALGIVGFSKSTRKESQSPYNLTITNKHWNRMRLQVRVGNQNVPENNTLVQDVILKRGESVTVGYEVLCYYRRDADPDRPDNVNFTTWTSAGCFRNQPCVVDNP